MRTERRGDEMTRRRPRPRFLPTAVTILALWLAVPSARAAAPAAADPKARGPLGPAEATTRFKVADGLAIDLVLAEPEITQPVFLNFDERGRLWVVEYRQYPDP